MTRFLFCVWQLRVSWCGAPSLTRGRVCNLLVQLLLCLARADTLGFKSRRNHGHILLSHLRLSKPGGPGAPRNRVAELYPRALGSLSIASYDSQGYGGDILTRFHWGNSLLMQTFPRYTASALTTLKTPLPIVYSVGFVHVGVTTALQKPLYQEPFPSNGWAPARHKQEL
jgi:hypothetical protein